jgi:hypothetical protein
VHYAVTWPGEPEVVYDTREALASAVRLRAENGVGDLEERLNKGWELLDENPGDRKLQKHWARLYESYDLLVRLMR